MALVPVRGMAVNVGEQTGDGRYIVPGAVSFADLPLPIGWLVDGQHADYPQTCPQVGVITSLTFVPGGIAYRGQIDDQILEGAELVRRMRAGSASNGARFGVSIDPDNWSVQLVDAAGGGEGSMLLMASGDVAEGERMDWERPVDALRRAHMVSTRPEPVSVTVSKALANVNSITVPSDGGTITITAAAGDGDPLANGSGFVVMEDSVDSLVARFTRLRIRGLTACAVPAFAGCYMELDDGVDAMSIGPMSLAEAVEVVEDFVASTTGFAAIPVHHTATTDTAWDGGAATKGANTEAALKYIHAWRDSSAGADPTLKDSYKFPHHAAGTDTPANLNGVRNALSRLPQSDIPSNDEPGVKRHLQAHLDDGNANSTAVSYDRVSSLLRWFVDQYVAGAQITFGSELRAAATTLANASACRVDAGAGDGLDLAVAALRAACDGLDHDFLNPSGDGACQFCLLEDDAGNCTWECGAAEILHHFLRTSEAADEAEDAEDQDEMMPVAGSSAPVRVKVNLAEPPRSWFQDPALPLVSSLTITNEGRVLGYVAAKNTCHTGYQDRCVVPPMGASYDRFHVGETRCSDGSSVATGVFAWGIPHADLTLPMIAAWEHYANSRFGFARTVVGEDKDGIWFSGALNPGVSENDVAILRGLSMSGDWRRDPVTRRLSLVAALAVNFPGFPIPRTESITAAGGVRVDPAEWELEPPTPTFHLDGDDVYSLIACGRVSPLTADCGCDEPDELAALRAEVAVLRAKQEQVDRVLGPLLPLIAEKLDLRNGP